MFTETKNSLTESGSDAEKICRQSMASAGYAFGDNPASFHWSQLINPLGDKNAAILAYETLLHIEPTNQSALEGLAYLYQTLGQINDAQSLRKQLRSNEAKKLNIVTENFEQVVDYLLAKTGEADQPNKVPSAFISAHFDHYASDFEKHLIDSLLYRGPDLIFAYLNQLNIENKSLSVLDLGCGTGLIAQAISPFIDVIDGVDLSVSMLKKANTSQIYRQLINQDLFEFLQQNKAEYDLITAADVFNYFGDLQPVFEQLLDNMQSGSRCIFTVERYETTKATSSFALRNTGRFQHSAKYIQQLLKQIGFELESEQIIRLRMDAGQPVKALLYSIKKR